MPRHDGIAARADRGTERSRAAVRAARRIRSALKQVSDQVRMTATRRPDEGGGALRVDGVNGQAEIEQRVRHCLQIATGGGSGQIGRAQAAMRQFPQWPI